MLNQRRASLLLALCSALVVASVLIGVRPVPTAHAAALSGTLSVVGNHLQANGAVVIPHGVNRSGTEYACIQDWGIFDGPSDAASVQAMASWGVNFVRIPLNEDCWLNINGVDPAYAGQNYIGPIMDYVNLLHQNGIYAELSLMWGAPGTYQATYQSGSPDEDHSPAMWQAMATAFKGDGNVILAPWGETVTDWVCFMQTGCNDEATYGPNDQGYQTAPMQQAVTLMRQAGYNGPISIPCIAYANNCNSDAPEWTGWGCPSYSGCSWLTEAPSDPLHSLVAEAHVYGKNVCDTAQCLTDSMTTLSQTVPLLFGETGETYDASDCNNSSTKTSAFLDWADAHGVGYEVWTWDTWGSCSNSLITDYNGTPYGVYGTYVQQHLQSLAGGSTPPTPTATLTASPAPTIVVTPTPTNTPTTCAP